MLIQKEGRWVFISRKTRRPLAYYRGEGKPSDEWVRKQEQRVQYFKHMGESVDVSEKGGLTIFDIDDTLFHTTAKVAVIKNGKVVRELSNQEFNDYKLKPGEEFNYKQFRSAQKFRDESKPIDRMLTKAKIILSKVKQKKNSKVIIVTARDDFDDKKTFLQTFRNYGLNIDEVRVERAGKIGGDILPAHKKVIIIRNYLNTGMFERVRLFDDSMTNLKEFLKLKREFPQIKFEAYFAKPDGTVKTVSLNEEIKPDILPIAGAGQWGTPELTKKYIDDTPGQKVKRFKKYIKNI